MFPFPLRLVLSTVVLISNVNPSMEMVLQNKPHLEIKYSGSKF